ncbi:MAG: hypothetical protein PHJ00_01550 [Candidatus Omnitrophica bacterium]|nr:hypothetical protein [Candidatus Omnitrophota bacterium]
MNDKFQVELSKSLINALMKQEGLSAPVGRRRKNPEILVEEAPEPTPGESVIPEEPAPITQAPLEEPPFEEPPAQEEPAQPPESKVERESIEEKLFDSSETPVGEVPVEEAPAEAPTERDEPQESTPLLSDQTEHVEPVLIEGKEPLEITSQVPSEAPAPEVPASEPPAEEIPTEPEPEPVETEAQAPEEIPSPEILVEKTLEPPEEEVPITEETEQKPIEEKPIEKPPVEETPVPIEEKPVLEQPIDEEPIKDEPVVTNPPLEITYKPEAEVSMPVQDETPPVEMPIASAQAVHPAPESSKEPPKESLTAPHIEDSPEIPDLGEGVGLGAVLLKAVDSIVGGTYYLTRLVKELLRTDAPELVSRTEGLIYAQLFKPPIGPDSTLWTLVNGKHDFQLVMSYLDDLHNNKALDIEASRAIPKLFQEVLYLDIFMEGGAVFHLDSELRSVWSVPNIPFDYALPINKAKSLINRYFIRNKPLVLFSAPGYDVPTKEFCDFVLQWDATDKKIEKITLVSNKADNIETIITPPVGHRYVVFGLWPWQFTKYRRVINVGEFKPFYFEPLDQHFYITESEVTLVQPYTNQSLVFRACLLKRDPASKTTLLIGTNIDDDKVSAGEIAELYLRHWPNLDEGFEDFSHKIELFTYTATSRRLFSIEAAIQETGKELEIRDILNYYLRGMDSYLRWHILPAGYEDYDFPTANARFYSLKAVFYKKNQYYLVQFYLPKGYNFEADLAYMCRRLNEKDIALRGGKVWFTYIKEQV